MLPINVRENLKSVTVNAHCVHLPHCEAFQYNLNLKVDYSVLCNSRTCCIAVILLKCDVLSVSPAQKSSAGTELVRYPLKIY
jgi:hypothetical protein